MKNTKIVGNSNSATDENQSVTRGESMGDSSHGGKLDSATDESQCVTRGESTYDSSRGDVVPVVEANTANTLRGYRALRLPGLPSTVLPSLRCERANVVAHGWQDLFAANVQPQPSSGPGMYDQVMGGVTDREGSTSDGASPADGTGQHTSRTQRRYDVRAAHDAEQSSCEGQTRRKQPSSQRGAEISFSGPPATDAEAIPAVWSNLLDQPLGTTSASAAWHNTFLGTLTPAAGGHSRLVSPTSAQQRRRGGLTRGTACDSVPPRPTAPSVTRRPQPSAVASPSHEEIQVHGERLRVIISPGDGNCMFHSLVVLLNRLPNANRLVWMRSTTGIRSKLADHGATLIEDPEWLYNITDAVCAQREAINRASDAIVHCDTANMSQRDAEEYTQTFRENLLVEW
eukprot:GHVU01010712.1.p1 GENE.GHVU01010712.1~~GHVU01010712.1.p1  ORF type:complete len:400 (+),score=14.86 GHVU01010712.1:1029-2228(+)